MVNLNEVVTQLDGGITAEQYLHDEEELSTCLSFDDADCANWRKRLRSTVVMDRRDQLWKMKNPVMKKKKKKLDAVSSHSM